MKYRNNIFPVIVMMILVLGFCFSLLPAEAKTQPLDQWLILGPAKIPDLEKNLLGDDKKILDFNHDFISNWTPLEGEKVPWTANQTLQWTPLKNPDFPGYETGVVYLATYLEPPRWLETTLNILNTNLGVSVFLDGHPKKAQLLPDKITAPLELTNEKHLLVLKILLLKGTTFTFKASLENDEPFREEKIAVSLTPHHKTAPENILNVIEVMSIWVSPDGKRAAVSLKQTDPESGKPDTWLEILDTASGNRVFSSRDFAKIDRFNWLKDSSTFSFTVTQQDKTSIHRYNLNSLSQEVLLKDLKNFSGYWWAPDNSFLVYCTSQKESSTDDYKYVRDIPDRAGDSGSRYSMFIYFLRGGTGNTTGTVHQISDEEQNFQSALISPDSKTILFTRVEADYRNRPYTKNVYYLFDVNQVSVSQLLETNWIEEVTWGPDSKTLLMVGGPSAFDGLGKKLPEGKIPNDYDHQAYIYDLNTRKAAAISKDFNPSIEEASWESSAGTIYFRATEGSGIGLFKYSVKNRDYRRFNTQVEVVEQVGFASGRNTAVYWGSSVTVPHKLFLLNLSGGNSFLLKDYNQENFKYVTFGTVKDWNFKTPGGKTITGYIQYPANFNPTRKYPCIVYYYGGTSPVTRNFGGRYPKDWYTANGYIVYVLQPSGTVGFGQEFSSTHVNDWGKVTSEEIIFGVKQLIKEHKYIDPQRIGAMGASYGGFMTQYLAAHTDIFAAYISHAGISSLASYWGVGDWGYTYSGVASADSFPWNRKELYVGHSPLFMAERITKPLLLLHGDIDNNVPPGESYQMFAALKLLGREVALITFKDQQHFVSEYKKRLQWMRSIIAWWDKYLKNQPEHWEYLYPPRAGERSATRGLF